MSTDTDGAPPSVEPVPSRERPDEVARSRRSAADAGSSWLQEEIQRRMAERSAGGGSGRHARRDGSAGAPPTGAGHVPRHSAAPPGPPAAPAAAPEPPEPPRPPVGAPSLPSAGPPVRPRPDENTGWSGPDASPDADERPRPSRPVPRAYRSGGWRVPSAAPASFGGPGFDAPATRPTPPDEQPTSGGAGFGAPAGPDAPAVDPRPDASPDTPVPAAVPTNGRAPQAGSDVLPPRAPARLLAAPDDVVEALGRRPAPDRPDPDSHDGIAATGPLLPAGAADTVLWSATMPPPDADGTATATVAVEVPVQRSAQPASKRVKVVLSERRGGAHPVRTVVDIQEGGVVGEMLRSDLIGSQLTVALRFALLAGLTIGLLPLAFALFPEIGRVELLGFRLPWLLLGFVVYPVLWAMGWWHTRTAERVEQNFADDVQR